MCIAAAIAGAAIIGGVGSAVAGHEAAGATKSATNASIAAQQTAQQQQQALNAPYASIGTGTPGAGGAPGTPGAIDQYKALLGLGPQGAAGVQQTLANTPGYQFQQQQGTQNTVNQASAMGLGLSGNTLEGLSKFNSGLADTTYQQAVGNAQNAVTIGQNAAAGTGSGILQTGANVGSALVNQGNTLAGIDANTIAGITKSAGNASNQYITANTLAGLNNPGGGIPDLTVPGAGASTGGYASGGQYWPTA